MNTSEYEFDVIVVGAGHAGTEAAVAAARMGANVALLTMNCDTVGQMSCNPAIGGVAKGQIVREIDALGGIMGQVIDATGIHFRLLNRSKGPAMHSPRAQADKKLYQLEVKYLVEQQPRLTLRQETVEELLIDDQTARPRMAGLKVKGGATYRAKAVVLTTGTFLQALMHTGETKTEGGRAGEGTTKGLSQTLKNLGFELARFKTGTPARLNGRTIDFAQTSEQLPDEQPQPFSFLNSRISVPQVSCWMTYTNETVHELIRANLHRAPMYSGQIQSSGPRYCPSIEDKVVRFAEKSQHQIFLEPEGRRTCEVYVNGVSTSLPRDVQDKMFRLIPGLQHAEIMRYGYAVEYDYAPPTQLTQALETKRVAGLYFAGQLNGTTGYEEAGAQGLLAGINAVLAMRGEEPLVLDRNQAYIGVLIDDLVTRGVDEPYRMFTSRAEYRLLLRHDNSDRRLTPLGRQIGLVDDHRWQRFTEKKNEIDRVMQHLHEVRVGKTLLNDTLRRTETTWDELLALSPDLAGVPEDVVEQVVIDVKYSGYVERQEVEIQRQQRLAEKRIPDTFDYTTIGQMRVEAREKLTRVRPSTFAQAGRISGITPADLALLRAHLDRPR